MPGSHLDSGRFFQTAANPNGSHGLNRSATSSYLRNIAVTAPQQTIYI